MVSSETWTRIVFPLGCATLCMATERRRQHGSSSNYQDHTSGEAEGLVGDIQPNLIMRTGGL